LLVFDAVKKEVIKSCEIIEPPYREYDPNPRGGFRGLKGISVDSARVAIANASTLFLYDHHWNPLGYFWHPSCAGIHDILLQHDHVWVTSSRNDLVFCFDLSGNIIKYIDLRKFHFKNQPNKNNFYPFLSNRKILSGKINFRDPRTHDHAITDRLHINSISILDNGDYLISCGLLRIINGTTLHQLNNLLKQTPFSKVLAKVYQFYRKVNRKDQPIKLEDKGISTNASTSIIVKYSNSEPDDICLSINDCTVPSHSIRLLNDRTAVYLNSSSGEILHFSPGSGKVYSTTKIGKHFLRGADQMEDGNIFVGDNNDLIHFDLSQKFVISRTRVTEDENEAIFDVHKLPDNFSLPPSSFLKLHESKLPIKQV